MINKTEEKKMEELTPLLDQYKQYKQRTGRALLNKIVIYFAFISSLISTGCMIYVVLWLEALRKGWLV